MRTRMLLATVMTLTVTACSTSNDATPSTTAAPSTTRASTTTSTTTTTQPTTTTTTTSAPPTTESSAPSTTESTDETQEAIDDFLAMWAAFDAAIREPTDDVLRASLLEWLSGEMRSAVGIVDEYRDQGLKARRRDDVPAGVEVEQASVEADRAELVVCELDSDEVVEVGSAPDGSDAVINDTITSRRFIASLERSPGGWLVSDLVVVDEWIGELSCDAA